METKNKYFQFVRLTDFHRFAGVSYIAFTFLYLNWLLQNINVSAFFISFPFLAFQFFSFLLVTISIINNWKSVYRVSRPSLPNVPPPVAVVVCTKNEPVAVVKKTLKSILGLSYPGSVVAILSNDSQDTQIRSSLEKLMKEMSVNWNSDKKYSGNHDRKLYLINTNPHKEAKAGNLNQALEFLKKYHSDIDLILTQDADEIVYPDILQAVVGYFRNPKVAYVQTIKQAKVSEDDPFGNRDFMWYLRVAPSRDFRNAMFACGSGVVWRISALETVGGFSTWNIVEDLTTSYNLLAKGWQGRYHYEALSEGLAPEDLPNYIKQRGTWAMDHMRIFFWDNPFFKKGLNFFQKLQFIEPPLFYLNGFMNLTLVGVTAISLIFEVWPTTQGALVHAMYLLPSFISLELYYLLFAGDVPFRRDRQYWIGLAPVFTLAAIKSLIHGPDRKPTYAVTRKQNIYGNYFRLVLPQVVTLSIILVSLGKILISTPLYSAFDWAAVFWGFYQASFFTQAIKVSWWKWNPHFSFDFSWGNVLGISSRRNLYFRYKMVNA